MRKLFHRSRANVEDHLVRRDFIDRDNGSLNVCLEFTCDYGIDRQNDLAACGRSLALNVFNGRNRAGLVKGFSNGGALREQKRVRHAAADDEVIHLLGEMTEYVYFRRNLGTANDCGNRPLRGIKGELQRADFGQHGRAGISGQQTRNRFGGCVRAVGDGEGVIHIDVAEFGDLSGESRVVLLLALVIAEVFQHTDLARRKAIDQRLRGRSNAVLAEENRDAEQGRQFLCHRLQRVLRHRLAVRAAEMRQYDNLRAAPQQVLESGKEPFDPGRIGDLSP